MGQQVMEQTDFEILVAAQERALAILSDAREAAERHRAGGREDAGALLLQQQQKAERLLASQQEEARHVARGATEQAAEAPEQAREAMMTDAARLADELLDRQWLAAEMLRASEEQVAVEAHDGVERAVIETLQRSHREAAAVLLEARMIVEDRRHRQQEPRASR